MNQPTAQQIKDTASLKQKKDRDANGLILVEGRHPIEEAWKAGLRLKHWFAQKDAPASSLPNVSLQSAALVADEKQMARMSSTSSAPPCIAVFEKPASQSKITGDLLLILEDLQDPGNLGTLIRSAIAFGFDSVILAGDSVEPWNPKVIRASAGLVFAIPVLQLNQATLLTQLENTPHQLYVTTGKPGSQSYRTTNYTGPCAIVLGNEGRGVSPELLNHPKAQALTIPMDARVESLNVGISGSIILAEVAAHRTALQKR